MQILKKASETLVETASQELNKLKAAYIGNENYLKGLFRAKRDADQSGVVSILVMLSDNSPSGNETEHPIKIAGDVWRLNQDKVKNYLACLSRRRSSVATVSSIVHVIMNGVVSWRDTLITSHKWNISLTVNFGYVFLSMSTGRLCR